MTLIHFDHELIALCRKDQGKAITIEAFELPPNYDYVGKSFFEIAYDCRMSEEQATQQMEPRTREIFNDLMKKAGPSICDESANSATEYAVLLAGVIILALLGIVFLGNISSSVYTLTGYAFPTSETVTISADQGENFITGFIPGGAKISEINSMMATGTVSVTSSSLPNGTTVTGVNMATGTVTLSNNITTSGPASFTFSH